MATVPGPQQDRPLPKPGAPGIEPPHEEEYEEGPEVPEPHRRDNPDWLPKPYDPERELSEPGVPIP
jgi:hypothetical protein